MNNSAIIASCQQYRYALTRAPLAAVVSNPPAVFIMLNPSTADATQDDPTIRRCRGFASSWGANGIVVVNLYGLRATDPAALWQHPDPVGPENDEWIRRFALEAKSVVCAWGTNARADRVKTVTSMLIDAGVHLLCLGVTKHGAPRHPLYIRADQELEAYTLC
ncbi:MAG: DUF1643 domain-containing protein [Gammaproteobacteria bacterium]|nr:DUF1643 domain-containing protein [Gammaproteobacteria bacterium]